MATKTATGPDGEKLTFRSATDKDGKQQWIQVGNDDSIKAGLESKKRGVINAPKLPYGMTQKTIDNANTRNLDKTNLIESIQNDPAMLEAYKGVKDEGFWKAGGNSALHELSMLGSGIMDLAEQGGEGLGMDFKESRANRAEEMTKERMISQGRSIASPVASPLGAMVPYVAADLALTPVISRGGGQIVKGINALGRTTKTGINKLDDYVIKQGLPGQGFTDDLVTTAENISKRKPLSADLGEVGEGLGTSGILGLLEGLAHYDKTALEGVLESVGGQAVGSLGPIRRGLGRVPSKLTQAQKDAYKTAKRMGMRMTPATKTGVAATQAKEAGYRSEPRTRNYMADHDAHNTGIMGDEAMRVMGIEDADYRTITKPKLKSHMDDLSDEYTALEKATTGKFDMDSYGRMSQILKELKPAVKKKDGTYGTGARNTSAESIEQYKKISDLFANFKNDMGIKPKELGIGDFDGIQYQQMSQRVKDLQDKAYLDGDKLMQRKLKEIQEELDSGLKTGMNKATAKNWDDANEKWAMSNLVMNKGLDANLGIDIGKLQGELMGPDAVRTTQGIGGRITDLQDLVSVNELSRSTRGKEGWTGSGVDQGNVDKQSLTKQVLTSQMDEGMPILDRIKMGVYMSGIPSTTGFTGLPRKAIPKIFRGASMGGDAEDIGNMIEKGGRSGNDKIDEMLQKLGLMPRAPMK